MTHGTIIETNTPTYHWATAAGAVASILGLVALAVCISVSAANPTPHGYAPMPTGITALAVVMTLGGLVLVLFRILHADREEMMRRLEAMDEKLNSVWGIAARTSIEAKPVRQNERHSQQRGRRRKRAAADSSESNNVVPLRARRAKEALRRLTEHITGEPDA